MSDAAEAPAVEVQEGLNKSATAKLIGALVLAAAFVTFAIQNSASIEVDFLVWSFSTPLIVLLVLSVVFGIVVWELVGLLRRRAKK